MSRNDSSESFMLRVLQKTFPEELGNLNQKDSQQKPDFQDQALSIGVEATIAQHGDNRMKRGHALFDSLEGTVPTPVQDAKLRELGITPVYENGVLKDALEVFWEGDSYPAIADAIADKLGKLNHGHYDAVKDVRLVVKDFRDVHRAEMLADTIRKAYTSFDAEGNGTRHFTHVYVIPDMQHCVYDYDEVTDTVTVHPFVY